MHRGAEHLQAFLECLRERYHVFYKSVAATAEQMPDAFGRIGGLMLESAYVCLGPDFARILAEGYVHLVVEVNRAQMLYEKRGCYQSRTYAEVYEAAYGNKEFMEKYHWGLYVATFAWVHHLKIFNFFEEAFLRKVGLAPAGEGEERLVADFGSGLGIWSRLLLGANQSWRCVGIDISPTSVEAARLTAERAALADRSTYVLGDATTYMLEVPADAVVSSFLLEHLEEPARLLENMAANLKVGGYAWITAALTAAEVDHIAEFRRETEVLCMLEDAGFRVVGMLSETPREANAKQRFVPRSMAVVAQKRRNGIW